MQINLTCTFRYQIFYLIIITYIVWTKNLKTKSILINKVSLAINIFLIVFWGFYYLLYFYMFNLKDEMGHSNYMNPVPPSCNKYRVF